MLASKNRLKKKKEFNFIYKKGKAYYTKYLALYVVPTRAKDIKIGFSVSNKVGNSVIRHKIKRRLSEIIRVLLKDLPKKNYIFVAKQNSDLLNFYDLQKEVKILLDKAKNEK